MANKNKIPAWKHVFIGMPAFVFIILSLSAVQYVVEEIWVLPRAKVVCVEKFGTVSAYNFKYERGAKNKLGLPTIAVCTVGNVDQIIHMNSFSSNALFNIFGHVLYVCLLVASSIPGFYILDHRYIWGEDEQLQNRSTTQQKNTSDDVGGSQK